MRVLTNILCTLLLVVATGSARGQTSENATNPEITVRAYFEHEDDVYVGQTIRLWVEITSATQFSQAPVFPDMKLEGAISLLPEQLGVNFSVRENGQQRIGQRQRYVIIPGRSGMLQIPPIPITVDTSPKGAPPNPTVFLTPATEMNVIFPPDVATSEQIVSVEELVVTEKYNRGLEGFKVGDALERSILIEASNTFALALPPIDFAQVDGTKVYRAQPELTDNVNRGQYLASRRDTATYMFEQETDIILPEIAVSWWDPARKKLIVKTLPSLSFHVSANPILGKPTTPPNDDKRTSVIIERWALSSLRWLQEHIISIGLTALGLYIFQLAWGKNSQRVTRLWHQYQARRLSSEKFAFSEFGKACRSRDEQRIRTAFWRWIDRTVHKNEITSLNQLAMHVPNSNFISLARGLAKKRFGQPYAKSDDMRNIYRQAKLFRRELLSKKKTQGPVGHGMLNPRSCN